MPIYEFACDDCGLIREIYRSIEKGPPKKVMCQCGVSMWHRMSCQFVLRGDGWAGKEAKHGADYHQRILERDRDEQEMHERAVAEKEAEQVIAERRKGRKSSKEFARSNKPLVERYRKNLRKGIGRNAGKRKKN